MSRWPAARAGAVLRDRERTGWRIGRQRGSHRTLSRDGWPDVTFAFHDGEEIGLRMLARITKTTGLRPEHL